MLASHYRFNILIIYNDIQFRSTGWTGIAIHAEVLIIILILVTLAGDAKQNIARFFAILWSKVEAKIVPKGSIAIISITNY